MTYPMKYQPLIAASAAALLLCSCETFDTPEVGAGSRKANLAAFTDPHVKKAYTGKPAITFPASLAVVRVQDASANGYTVATTRELETAQDYNTISKNPGIAGVVSLNRLLLPASASSPADIREAAAKLHTDAILIYTVASETHDNDFIAPLTVATLGLAPNKTYKVSSSASAILMDTRTGYIYGALEQGDTRNGLTMTWGSDTTIDSVRRQAERAAYEKLLASFDPFWKRLYARYNR